MSETMTREEKREALDEFASVGMQEDTGQLPVPINAVTPQIVGAQLVAVHRDEQIVLKKLKVLAAAAGTDWYYRFPVQNRRENRTDWIEGPSIKMANDLARLYGNCEVDCRAADLGGVIMYHARFIDLETGFALTRPFQQRKGAAKLGGSDEQRREDITFQIGASKAIRNVVVNALQTFADFAFEEAKNALVDKIGKDLVTWRERTVERVGARVDIKRVEAVVGRVAGQWLAPDVARVIAMGKAIEDGMATWEETFPPLRVEQAEGEALDRFADQSDTAASGNPSGGAGEAPGPAENPGPGAQPEAGPMAEIEAARQLQRSAIDICLRLAVNPQLTDDERLEQLDNIGPSLDGVGEAQLKTIINTAADVVRGKLKAQDARRYLEGMVK